VFSPAMVMQSVLGSHILLCAKPASLYVFE
jgi:hypothetical protein